jgi:DNA-binding NtrC family response regulator
MAKTPPKILLVDDEERFLNSIAERLKLLGFDPLKASSGRKALALAQDNRIDLAIVDLKMPDMDGLVTITKLKEISPDLRSVLLTGYGGEKVKEATKALDAAYFEKDRLEDFWEFVENKMDPISPPGRHRMIGETLAMQELRKNIERLAALDCPVIIRGETGTGKELAARTIHGLSPRKNSRFIAINCGCFRNDLLIEELARPENPVIPGVDQMRPSGGRPESGGTVLLDQIEDMSPKMQLAMLKIIDSKEVSLLDGSDNFPFDVRIFAASRYHLGQLAKEGKFREELYYRLNVLELYLPPLRERRDDIPPLCGYFLDRFAREFKKGVDSISDEVVSIFMSYDFPGNVRELEHIIERAVILADGKTIKPKHLPGRFQKAPPSPVAAGKKFIPLAEMEKQYILEVLAATGGNKSKTVELLGISRAALWRKLKQFGEENRPSRRK